MQGLICGHSLACSLVLYLEPAVHATAGVTYNVCCRERPYDDLPDEAEEGRRKSRRREDTSPDVPRSAAACMSSIVMTRIKQVDMEMMLHILVHA